MSTPTYLTAADLAAFFSADEVAQLADSGTNAAALIASTNAEVHAYLSALVGTRELATMPQAVKVKAADIARFYLYKDAASDLIIKRWEAASAWLRDVAKGVIPLTLDFVPLPEGEAEDPAGVWSEPGTSAGWGDFRVI